LARAGPVLDAVDRGVRSGEEQRLVTRVGPPHEVRRAAVLVADLQDDGVPDRAVDMRAPDHQPVTYGGKHRTLLPSAPGTRPVPVWTPAQRRFRTPGPGISGLAQPRCIREISRSTSCSVISEETKTSQAFRASPTPQPTIRRAGQKKPPASVMAQITTIAAFTSR